MFLCCTSQGVVTTVKWLISLVVTSNHKCLNKVVSNITTDFNYFRARTWPPRWYSIILCYWCLNRHLCILPERFVKKDLNLVIVCRNDVMS